MGMILEMLIQYTGKYEPVCHNFIGNYVKYGVNIYMFVCLDNNMVVAMEHI